ncbi:hypothetical protein JQX13_09635 [Archangium violaceum]|uniref:hypothetical protein n=1 Tax=Archangium violaceum TaxID=83451 RepID=UPI00193C0561|nr:hypothetical protein [Archangium violaceum]QRK10322.1 hypothetical protein JQX13_09635 [Archangium violaceum]
MRTYSFDHYKADKPEPSTTNPGGAEQTPPAEQAKPAVPPSEEGQLHYGRQHARTAELYQKRREERERAEQLSVSEAQQEPMGSEVPPMEASKAETQEQPAVAAQQEEPGHEGLKELAQDAVTSVVQAAREAAKGRPLTGARKLAGDAMSGVLRVAREVSALRAEKKGPGKKR